MARRKHDAKKDRPGRQLEELVSKLEGALAGTGIAVTSPEQITDLETGESREVDVSLRGKVGSTEVLVIVECRDRGRAQTVQWIEELAGKAAALGASRAVAVSSNGFTTAAIAKARAKNIALRVLRRLTPEDVRQWLPIHAFAFEYRETVVRQWRLFGSSNDSDVLEKLGPTIAADAPLFRTERSVAPFSLEQLYRAVQPRAQVLMDEKIPTRDRLPDKPPAEKTTKSTTDEIVLSIVVEGLRLAAGDIQVPIKRVDAVVVAETTLTSMSLQDGSRYGSPERDGETHAAHFALGSVFGVEGTVELTVFPAAHRLEVSAVDQEGRTVEVFCSELPGEAFGGRA